MRAFRFLTAAAVIFAAAPDSRADPSPDIVACKETVTRGSFFNAIPTCRLAFLKAETPEDKATVNLLISEAQAGIAASKEERRGILDGRMVINPDADPQRRGDEDIVINRSLY